MFCFLHSGSDAKIESILKKECPFISHLRLKQLFKQRDIKVNGQRVGMGFVVQNGEQICVYEKLPTLKCVYEDDNLLIIDKPKKLASAGTQLSAHSLACNQFCPCLAVHRLDTNTSGLLMLAKNEQALNALKKASTQGQIAKTYLAQVTMPPNPPSATLTAYLKKLDNRVALSAHKREGYQQITTSYELVEQNEMGALLRVRIISGKTHQIRAHLAFVGLPILGDTKYGSFEQNRASGKSHQELRAVGIEFKDIKGGLGYLSGKSIVLE